MTGSPRGTNFFQIEGPNIGGRGVDRIRTSFFAVQGKIIGAHPTQLSLRADPSKVKPGRATKLSGRFLSFGRPLAGRTTVLQKRPKGATKFSFVPGGRLATDARGTFTKVVRPNKSTTYRATFAGERGGFKASHAIKRVIVIRR